MNCISVFAAKGGFGEVWRAEWNQMEFAVKIFRSPKYESWGREREIYKTCMLAHKNILRFWTMEKNDTGELCLNNIGGLRGR